MTVSPPAPVSPRREPGERAEHVDTFGLHRSPRTLLFGAGQRRELGRLAGAYGTRALVCTDARLAASDTLRELVDDLGRHGVTAVVWADTQLELPIGSVEACYAVARTAAADMVIGVGGGSCLDMAKAIALLLSHGGPLDRYYGEDAVPGPTVPVIAVPTTAGTGSEATPVLVVNDESRELKTGISSVHLIPAAAICDPELTYTCPPALTASAGADALTHLVESFTAIRRPSTVTSESRVFMGKNVISDMYARWGLGLVAESLPRAFRQPDDRRARARTMLAANAGGQALSVAGTAAAHALQYPLGALTHTPHGVGVGVLLPYVMRFNLPARVAEFCEIAAILGSDRGGSPRDVALAGIEAVDRVLDAIGIPATLQDLGLPRHQVDYVARMGLRSRRLVDNNPRPLGYEELLAITEAAYTGDRHRSW